MKNCQGKRLRNPQFALCCMSGKVQISYIREPPPLLKRLLIEQTQEATQFHENIRAYNSTFVFTSMGGIIDPEINNRRGPYVFRLNGQNHHLIRSMLPMQGQQPRFVQLYTMKSKIEIRLWGQAREKKRLDETLLDNLMSMLDEPNVLVQSFRVARERYTQDDVGEFRLRIVSSREKDGRQYNIPTSSEIPMLIVGDLDENAINRDITKGITTYNKIAPVASCLCNTLYCSQMVKMDIGSELSIREYYAFRIQIREEEGRTIVLAEKLKDQYISHMETRTQNCLEREQSSRPCIQAAHDTKFKTIKMQWQYVDGPVLYIIEFQQRGLPHTYILVFLQCNDKNPSPAKIDRIISAEIHDRQEDVLGYQAVQDCMIHGPCEVLNPRFPCMHDYCCTKHYPKKYYEETTVDEQGFPVYRRRRNNNTLIRNGIEIDNQFIVPYNRDLIVKYQ
ncbi:LOW QUALITY PROTEIN: hypothetical protein Tsubulata_040791, partial [Turnera subulata]